MKKRFQIFVSSTYEDLKLERQAAVESILKARHIPAGMELFTAGDKSQMDVIRRWIDESDLFMMILGARYGSIEPTTGKSYVELEFNYAIETSTPFFSVVLSDEGREEKVKSHGTRVLESAHEDAYRQFHKRVTSHLCAFFSTPIDVKVAVFETLPQIIEASALVGWVSAADIESPTEVANHITHLSKENLKLRAENERLQTKLEATTSSGASFDELYSVLQKKKITVQVGEGEGAETIETNLVQAAIGCADDLARGVTNQVGVSDTEGFVYYQVASPLASYGLVQPGKSPPSVAWTRLILSKEGMEFLTRARILQEKTGGAASPAKKKSTRRKSSSKAKTTESKTPSKKARKTTKRRKEKGTGT